MISNRFNLALASIAIASFAGAAPRNVLLSRKGGVHRVSVRVGDTLLFDTTEPQSASTGYVWRGPKLSGSKVFGKVDRTFVKASNYDRLRAAMEKQPMPGRPSPYLGSEITRIRVAKVGRGKIQFVLSRLDINRAREKGDVVCNYEVTVKAASK